MVLDPGKALYSDDNSFVCKNTTLAKLALADFLGQLTAICLDRLVFFIEIMFPDDFKLLKVAFKWMNVRPGNIKGEVSPTFCLTGLD